MMIDFFDKKRSFKQFSLIY